ncbi:MAG: ester cyclase [Actinomycetota bacterium]|nr:ester cyclase [Actinomycetota bacterium]
MGEQQERNKRMVRRFIDGYQTGGDPAVLEELLAPDVVDHSALPGFPPGREGVGQLFGMFRQAFPDFRAEILDQMADGDKVITRKAFLGTHRGPFMGVPATGQSVRFELIDIVRLEDGRIVEHWNVVDQLGLMRQLGAIPA